MKRWLEENSHERQYVKPKDSEATENGIYRSTASRKVGAALAIIGALLVILFSWLSLWWTVPAIREEGTQAGGSAFGLWSISIPLGGILVVTGAALLSG